MPIEGRPYNQQKETKTLQIIPYPKIIMLDNESKEEGSSNTNKQLQQRNKLQTT